MTDKPDSPPVEKIPEGMPAAKDTSLLAPSRQNADDFDAALTEWDQTFSRDVAPAGDGVHEPTTDLTTTEAPANADAYDPTSAFDPATSSRILEAERHLYEAQRLEQELADRVEHADAMRVISQIREQMPEVGGVPDKALLLWLHAEYQTDERLHRAWDNRHADPKEASYEVRRTIDRVRKEFASAIDPAVTADVQLVAQAVRSGGLHTAPVAPPPQWTRLSNKAFADAVEAATGVRPARLE